MRRRRLALAFALLALAVPSAASADETLLAARPLSHNPPTTPSSPTHHSQPQLPATGADSWITGLSGVTLVLLGLGLRLVTPARER
jgi:hypothetical protein